MNDRNDRENKAARARRKKFLNPFRRLFHELDEINCKLERIMANETVLLQQLNQVRADLVEIRAGQAKTGTEIGSLSGKVTTLVETVAELRAIIDAGGGGEPSPELLALLTNVVDETKAVKDQMKVLDEMIEDEPTPEPIPE